MPHKCKVRCIETGVIYNSMKEAIKDVGLKNDRGIYDSIRNPNKTSAGFHWEYYEEPDLPGEIWREAKHYTFGTDELISIPEILVSNKGRVKSLSDKQILEGKLDFGYIVIGINNKSYRVHRLVASTFIPNPDPINKSSVNHIKEEEKHNNDVSNLEWVTIGENNEYGTRTERARKTFINSGVLDEKFRKRVYCISTGETFNSIKDAAEKYNLSPSRIGRCCNGDSCTCGDKYWCFEKDKDNYTIRKNRSKRQVRCIETGVIYSSIREATVAVGLNADSCIKDCCKGEQKTAGGYHWEYVNEEDAD